MKHNILKTLTYFSITLLMIFFSINTARALLSDGVMVSVTENITQGGSTSTTKWNAPTVPKPYKVWVQIPGGSTASNAEYHVYPKGNVIDNTECSSTDTTHPCFSINVNQASNKNKWVQLILNGKASTSWKFSKLGYINVSASTISSSEQLGVASLSFEDATPLAIGRAYRGGIIFYLNKEKTHGLIAAPQDQSDSVKWDDGFYSVMDPFVITEATGTAVGTGQANTTAIIKALGNGNYAAKRCADLVIGAYSDWYLPSKDELNLMYTNIGQGAVSPLTNVGGFASDNYWSSTETNDSNAFIEEFSSFEFHGSGNGFKSFPLRVRAVRAF